MKATKLILAIGLLGSAAQAATISISAGLPAQGVTPLVNTVVPTNFTVSVGTWDAGNSTFTTFGSAFTDSGEVNGSVSATGPSTFNSQLIAIMISVGGGTVTTDDDSFAVFKSNTNTSFPSDVSAATNVTFSMTTPAALTILYKSNAESGFVTGGVNTNNFNLVTIPEPSSALLGAVGALGLLRRRRN